MNLPNGHAIKAPGWFVGAITIMLTLLSLGWGAKAYFDEIRKDVENKYRSNRALIEVNRIRLDATDAVAREINFRLCRLEEATKQVPMYYKCRVP